MKNLHKDHKEEHINNVCKSGGQYTNHVIPANGTKAKIAANIFEYLEKNSGDMSQFVAIVCNGIATNTILYSK